MLFEYVCYLTTTTTTTTTKIVLVLMISFIMFIDILTSSSHILIQLFRGTLVFLY